MKAEWIRCPDCGHKTRNKIREDTVLINYPLYCPKCKKESLNRAEKLHIAVINEPDVQLMIREILYSISFVPGWYCQLDELAELARPEP